MKCSQGMGGERERERGLMTTTMKQLASGNGNESNATQCRMRNGRMTTRMMRRLMMLHATNQKRCKRALFTANVAWQMQLSSNDLIRAVGFTRHAEADRERDCHKDVPTSHATCSNRKQLKNEEQR